MEIEMFNHTSGYTQQQSPSIRTVPKALRLSQCCHFVISKVYLHGCVLCFLQCAHTLLHRSFRMHVFACACMSLFSFFILCAGVSTFVTSSTSQHVYIYKCLLTVVCAMCCLSAHKQHFEIQPRSTSISRSDLGFAFAFAYTLDLGIDIDVVL